MEPSASPPSPIIGWSSPSSFEELQTSTTKFIPHRKFRLISLDGGGVREMIPATLIPNILHRAGNIRLSECTDMLIGTSAGGLVGAALIAHKNGNPVIENAKIPEFWKTHASEVFHATWLNKIETLDGLWKTKYCATGLEKVIGSIFDETMTFESNLSIPAVFPAFRFNDKESQTVYFATQKEFPSLESTLAKIHGINLPKVLRCTTAAPTYLPAMVWDDYNYVDGGLFSNNPAADGFLLACQKAKFADIEVLSFGTGNIPHSIAYKELVTAGLIKYAPTILSMMFKCQEVRPEQLLTPENYHRFQIEIESKDADLDGVLNLNDLEAHTFTWIKDHEGRLNKLAATLKIRDPLDPHAQEQETYT